MKSNTQKIIFLAIIVSLLFLLSAVFIYGYFGWFSRYIADDYCTAGELLKFGYWGSIVNRYLTWDGRYSFAVLIYFFEQFGIRFPSILPVLSIGLLVMAAFFFWSRFLYYLKFNPPFYVSLAVTLIFVMLVEYTIPQVGEVFFWMTGIATYQIAIICELFLLGLVIQTSRSVGNIPLRKMMLSIILIIFLTFVCSGFSEVSTVIHLAIFGLLFALALVKFLIDRNNSYLLIYYLILFVVAVLGFVLMAKAPGNLVRESSLKVHSGIYEISTLSISQSIKYLLSWILTFPKILFLSSVYMISVGYFNAARKATITKEKLITDRSMLAKLFVLFTVLLIVSFVPTTWAGYDYPPQRILVLQTSILSCFLILLSFWFGNVIGGIVSDLDRAKELQVGIVVAVLITLSVGVFMENSRAIYRKTAPIQIAYAETWDNVHKSIMDQVNTGEQNIIVNNIAYDLMNLERIKGDPKYWTNICAARFYQVKTIRSK